MKVVFLDIDGVLNSNFWNQDHTKEISEGKYVDSDKVKLLAKIIKASDASIILHSGWRFWFDENNRPTRKEAEYLETSLRKYGLSIQGATPNLTTEEIRKTKKFSKVKAEEILTWIQNHDGIDGWVVLEDLDLNNSIVEKHQVRTDSEHGLTENDVIKALEILN